MRRKYIAEITHGAVNSARPLRAATFCGYNEIDLSGSIGRWPAVGTPASGDRRAVVTRRLPSRKVWLSFPVSRLAR